jgi:membrane-associated phospholipid phosphatase
MTLTLADVARTRFLPRSWLSALITWSGSGIWWVLRLALPILAILALGRIRTAWSLPAYFALAAVALLILLSVCSRDRTDRRTWIAYVALFVVFAQLRRFADETGLPAQFDYAILIERALFLGTIPTVWLQERIFTPGAVGMPDLLLAVIYTSYFLAPHLTALLVWRLRPTLLPRLITALVITFYVGLVVALLLPTAPPWLAAEEGQIEPVARVMTELTRAVSPNAHQQGERFVGSNDVAAMPSLHMAITVIVALALARFGRIPALIGLAYALSMGVALVYLGEHYVVDELAGIATAVAAWKLAGRPALSRWLRPADTIATSDESGPGFSLRTWSARR